MNKNTVTQDQIKQLLSEADIKVSTVQEKCTIVTVTLKNGFILTESSACVDKANYNEEIGAQCCLERIERKLWELEGYALQKEIAQRAASGAIGKEKTARERVEDERSELLVKCDKLGTFLRSGAAEKLNDGEVYLLQLQLEKMLDYADILTARLGVWRDVQ